MLGCRKQAEIKEALQHSWKGYADYAWGMDELTPLTKAGASTLNPARGVTLPSQAANWAFTFSGFNPLANGVQV